jgi:RNA polymerase sigma factor (sigma-70 family)
MAAARTLRLRLRPDEQLVALFRAGLDDAFEAIHERYRRRLLGVAARTLRHHGGDPEGIVQEAFVRAHHSLRADDRPLQLKPWLHRVVRNLCADELRRRRVATEALGDVPGGGDDVLATLGRREELRRLIEDLADLPEQQRSALLLRELDGLSHEQVAAALDVSPAASRRLVARARGGLVAAAEARDAACGEIRADLLTAHDERRRPAQRTLRHVSGCTACRDYRAALKATRARLRALVPPIGLGPLAGVLQLLGGGGAAAGGLGGGAKLAAVGCCAVLAGGGAAALLDRPGERHVTRGPVTSTRVEVGGTQLIGRPIRPGTRLPASIAIASVSVELPAGVPRPPMRAARVTCPRGFRAAGLAVPHYADGRNAEDVLRAYQYGPRDWGHVVTPRELDRLDGAEPDPTRGHRRRPKIRYSAKPNLPAPAVVRIGTFCKRPQRR